MEQRGRGLTGARFWGNISAADSRLCPRALLWFSSFFSGAESLRRERAAASRPPSVSEGHLGRDQRQTRSQPRLGGSSRGGSFVLGSVSSPHRARRCAEDGHGRGGAPAPKRLSSESNLRVRRSGERLPSPVSGHRVQHAGQRGELWSCSWLRRRTHRRHIERSRSLFCLARWPALFFTRAHTHTHLYARAHTHTNTNSSHFLPTAPHPPR